MILFIFGVSDLLLLSPDCRFSVFLPSTVACACVSLATQRLKLVDAAVATDLVMKFLADLLPIDLVRVMFNLHFSMISLLTLPRCQHSVIILASTLIKQSEEMHKQTFKCMFSRANHAHVVLVKIHRKSLSMTCCCTSGCFSFNLTLNRALSSSAMTSLGVCWSSACPLVSRPAFADQEHTAQRSATPLLAFKMLN